MYNISIYIYIYIYIYYLTHNACIYNIYIYIYMHIIAYEDIYTLKNESYIYTYNCISLFILTRKTKLIRMSKYN